MARKAKECENVERLFAVFFDFSGTMDFIIVKNVENPIRDSEGTLVFHAGGCGSDNFREKAVFKEWVFYKEIVEEDIDGLHEWVDGVRD